MLSNRVVRAAVPLSELLRDQDLSLLPARRPRCSGASGCARPQNKHQVKDYTAGKQLGLHNPSPPTHPPHPIYPTFDPDYNLRMCACLNEGAAGVRATIAAVGSLTDDSRTCVRGDTCTYAHTCPEFNLQQSIIDFEQRKERIETEKEV